MANYYVYVMGQKASSRIFIGMTNDLKKRVMDHKKNLVAGFSAEYKVDSLIYYETFSSIEDALAREKMMKQWSNREWLMAIILFKNPLWIDLYDDIEVFV